MEVTDTQDAATALNNATSISIANLSPDAPPNSTTRGIATVIWPYSAVKGTYAFTLAEPDFRLRLKQGQVRVNLRGPAATALGQSRLESQDEVILSLTGAQWHPAHGDRRKSVSGADIDWEVTFTDELNIQVRLSATGEVKFISAAQAAHQEKPPLTPEPPASIESSYTPIEFPEPTVSIASPPRHKTPAKSGRIALLGEDEFASPAFIKRARASYGSLFEDGYDIFDDDDDGANSRRKRARFGRGTTSWRYTSKSPSPEPEMAESPPKEKSPAPDAPADVEQQPATTGVGIEERVSSSPMQVDDGVQTDTAEILQTRSPVLTAERVPALVPMSDHGTRSATDSLFDPSRAGSMEDTRPLSPSWNVLSTSYSLGPEAQGSLDESHTNILPMEMQHDLSSLPHDPSHIGPGLLGHPNIFHDMEGGVPIEYSVQEEQITESPFSQSSLAYGHSTSDYPPLETVEHHQISSNNHYPDPSLTDTQVGLFGPPFGPNPFIQQPESTSASEHHQSSFGVTNSWTSANRSAHPSTDNFRSRTGTSEGSTSEQPLVLDDSDDDEQSEHGSHHVRQNLTDDEDAEGEREVDVEYSEDEEQVLDDPGDDAGDYDTNPHPADDEDDSHDEDLQIHRLEPEFDVPQSEEDSDVEEEYDEDMQDMVRADTEQCEDAGAFDSQVEDEEERSEDDQDGEDLVEGEEDEEEEDEEEEDEEEEDYSDKEAASSPPRSPQKPPQPKKPAQPVVIDLLSSSEDESAGQDEEEEEEDEEEDEEEEDKAGNTQLRHDTQGQEDDEEGEEDDSEEDIDVEGSDGEDIEKEDDLENIRDDESEDEEQSKDEHQEEDIEAAISPAAATQARETSNVEPKTSSLHASGVEIAVAPEYDMEEDEVHDETMHQDSHDLVVDPEAIASEASHASQQESSKMWDIEPKVATSDVENRSKTGLSDVLPEKIEATSTPVQQTAVVEAESSNAEGPGSPEAIGSEQSKQDGTDGTTKDVAKQAPLESKLDPTLEDPQTVDRSLTSHQLERSVLQQADMPMSSPPPTQVPKTQEFVLEFKGDEEPDAVMADTEDMEVDEYAQQLPTPMDTQIERVEIAQAETELATSFESIESLWSSGVFNASEQMVVSTTTTITSQDLKAAPQAPGTAVSENVFETSSQPEETDIPEDIEFPSQFPNVTVALHEAVDTSSVHLEDSDQGDTQPLDQDYLQSSLDDELQASILEDYSQELDNEPSQLEDSAFIKPQMPIIQSSPDERRASASARMSTPPRLPQPTDDSPDSDVGLRLIRAVEPSTSQTDASPRARRQMARTRLSQRSPSPRPSTPKVQSSPAASIKSPKQTRPVQIPMESSPEVEDHSILLARASFPNQTSAASSVKDDSSRLEDDSESMATIKLHLARHLRDELRDCYILEGLRYHLNKNVDVIAVVMMQPAEPQRTKAREYAMSFTITDHSIGPNAVMEVQFYRPHKETLPVVKPGDVILLRRFKVMSLTNKGFGLRTQPDGSSWAVFDREGEPAQIKGPPVEYDAKESIYVDYLREWHNLLDEKGRNRLERANKRIVAAGSAKKK